MDEPPLIYAEETEPDSANCCPKAGLHRYGELTNSLNYTLNMYVANEYNPQQVWNNILAILLRITGSERGFAGRVHNAPDGTRKLKVCALSYAEHIEEPSDKSENRHSDFEPCNIEVLFAPVIENEQPVISNNPADDLQCFNGQTHESNVQSLMGVPIHYGNQLVGVYGVANSPDGYSNATLEFLRPLTTTVSFIIRSMLDAEQRDEINAKLRESERKFRAMFNALPIGIAISDKNGNIVDLNPACETIFGMSKDEILSGRLFDSRTIVRPDGSPRPKNETALQRALDERRIVSNVESGVVTGHGDIRWMNVNAAPMPEAGDGVIVSYSDITRRKAAEDDLKEHRKFLNAVLNGIDVAVFVVDVEQNGGVFRFNSANTAYEKYNGFRNSLLAGKTIDETSKHFTPESTENIIEACRECCRLGKYVEYEEMLPFGEIETWWLTRATPIKDEQGKVQRIIFASSQITDRVINERNLREMNARLEDINSELDSRVKERIADLQRSLSAERELNLLRDTFTGVVAHQFRTPLTVILSNVEVLHLYSDSIRGEKREQLFRRLFGAINAIQDLLEAIRKIEEVDEKIHSMRLLPISCSFLLQTVIDNFMETSGGSHKITLDISENLIVTADEFMLRSILFELLSNAANYSPKGSEIIVTAKLDRLNLVISVADKGIGVEPEDINRIVEPFYRTKRSENIFGAGLGLAIVERYSAAINGMLTCSSVPDEGSTFSVVLPMLKIHAGV